MASMILEVYDAFRSIGIDDDNARKAAGALSENPKAIADLRSEIKDEFSKLRTERVVVWTMLGFLIAGVLSIVAKIYF